MSDLLLSFGLALAGLGLVFGGLTLGVWTYAHIYAHFQARSEDQRKRELAALELRERRREERFRVLADKVKRVYGAMPPEHEEQLNGEVERILSDGPK